MITLLLSLIMLVKAWKIIFRAPVVTVPLFIPFLDDQLKSRIDEHVRNQLSLGNNTQSETISGVQVLNWADKQKTQTLLRKLMDVESIH